MANLVAIIIVIVLNEMPTAEPWALGGHAEIGLLAIYGSNCPRNAVLGKYRPMPAEDGD